MAKLDLHYTRNIGIMYGVTVVSVNTAVMPGKKKSRFTKGGVINGKTSAFKKAMVTLKEGDNIDFYSNI